MAGLPPSHLPPSDLCPHSSSPPVCTGPLRAYLTPRGFSTPPPASLQWQPQKFPFIRLSIPGDPCSLSSCEVTPILWNYLKSVFIKSELPFLLLHAASLKTRSFLPSPFSRKAVLSLFPSHSHGACASSVDLCAAHRALLHKGGSLGKA